MKPFRGTKTRPFKSAISATRTQSSRAAPSIILHSHRLFIDSSRAVLLSLGLSWACALSWTLPVFSCSLVGSPSLSCAVLGCPALSWAVLCSPVLSCALLVSPGLSWAVLCSPVLSWALLSSPGPSCPLLGIRCRSKRVCACWVPES